MENTHQLEERLVTTTEIHFDLVDRIKILFGRIPEIEVIIWVPQPVEMYNGTSSVKLLSKVKSHFSQDKPGYGRMAGPILEKKDEDDVKEGSKDEVIPEPPPGGSPAPIPPAPVVKDTEPPTFEVQEEKVLEDEKPEPPVEAEEPQEVQALTPVEEAITPPTEIICGFPGIGKTHYYRQSEGRAMDSDSGKFNWISKGVLNPAFPVNYINHIKENIGKADIIMVSSHREVREALVEAGLGFTLIYPDKTKKAELLTRYRERGSDEAFLELIDTNWDKFMKEMEEQKGCIHVVLPPETYLSDYLTERENQES